MLAIIPQALKTKAGRTGAVAVVVALGAFLGGWKVAEWRYGARLSDYKAAHAQAVADAVAAREAMLVARFQQQQAATHEVEVTLAQRLAAIRTERDAAEAELAAGPRVLIKEVQTDGECRNPFSADFVHLWNHGRVLDDAGTGGAGLPGTGVP
jgi:hypothetical protein